MNVVGEVGEERTYFYAKKGPAYASFADQVLRNLLGQIDGDGEADAGRRAARGKNGGIDADHFAVRIQQRPARIASIDGRVGLNGVFDKRRLAGLHGSAEGADYSSGQRGLEPKGIADGQNFLSHKQRTRVGQRQRYEFAALGVDLDQRHVIALVGAEQLSYEPRLRF